jgi:hypothetical protein
VGISKHRWDGPDIPLALHWDGAAWSRVPLPRPLPDGGKLKDVAMVSPTDGWAVGSRKTSDPPHEESLIAHWDGTTWSYVPGPIPGTYLSGVVALSSSNVWAVGLGQGVMVQHWNGQRWRVVRAPVPAGSEPPRGAAWLDAVDALGPGEVWAVGGRNVTHGLTFVERYGIPFCTDGIDNDGDGTIDYPADGGCTSATDGSEFAGTVCDNGYEDDHDGLIDYPQDPGCASASDASERGTVQCDDGIDNDADGKVDYRADGRGDPQCISSSDDSELT